MNSDVNKGKRAKELLRESEDSNKHIAEELTDYHYRVRIENCQAVDSYLARFKNCLYVKEVA